MKLTVQEKKWRAESDADTLSRAAEIKADKKRMAAAERAAMEMANNMLRAVGKKTTRSLSRQAMNTLGCQIALRQC